MSIKIDVTDARTGLVHESVITDSYLLLFDDGNGNFKVTGNLVKQFVMGQAGGVIREIVGRFARGR